MGRSRLIGGSERGRVSLSFSHQIRAKAVGGPRNPISQARVLSFCTQIVVADLEDLFSFGPPTSTSMSYISSEVSTAVCAAHIPGDVLGWKMFLISPPVKRIVSMNPFLACMCVLLWTPGGILFSLPLNLDWTLWFTSTNEYGRSDVLRLPNPGLRGREASSLPLGIQLSCKKSSYSETTMWWGSPNSPCGEALWRTTKVPDTRLSLPGICSPVWPSAERSQVDNLSWCHRR